MPEQFQSLRAQLLQEISLGKMIDVEYYCALIAQVRPELTHKHIQDIILGIVADYGGNASWGEDFPTTESDCVRPAEKYTSLVPHQNCGTGT